MMQSTLSRFARTAATRTSFATPTTSVAFANARWMSSTGDILCDKIAFIGTGMMAQSMIRPLINKGYQPAEKIGIYDVSTSAMQKVGDEFGEGIQLADSIADLVHDADMIICAVKPQNINAQFWEQFPSKMRDDAIFMSILAGKPLKEFRPSGLKKIVRGMPNTPAQIGAGMTVWCCTSDLTASDRDSVKKVLNAFGQSVSSMSLSNMSLSVAVTSISHKLSFL